MQIIFQLFLHFYSLFIVIEETAIYYFTKMVCVNKKVILHTPYRIINKINNSATAQLSCNFKKSLQ